MNTKHIIGKRIVRVDQVRFYNTRIGKMDVSVNRIVLEDGTSIYPLVAETEDDGPVIDFGITKPKKRKATNP